MNDSSNAQNEGSLPPNGDTSDPARAADPHEEDHDLETGDTLPPGVVPSEAVRAGGEQDDVDGDRAGEPGDTLPPGEPPSELAGTGDRPYESTDDRGAEPGDGGTADVRSFPSYDVKDGEGRPVDEDAPGATETTTPAGEEDTLIGQSAMAPPDDESTLTGEPAAAPASDAVTVIKSAVSGPPEAGGGAAQQPAAIDASPTVRSTQVLDKKAPGDWKWLALGAVGLVLLLGLVAGILTLVYVVGPIQPPRPTPMFDVFPSRARPGSKTGTPGAAHTSPPAHTLPGSLVVPTDTPSPGSGPRSTPTGLSAVPSEPEDMSATTSTVGCEDDLRFVADVTVPDDTEVKPGERFDKTWHVRNNGTCPWDSAYRLRFLLGDRMGASDAQRVALTGPGQTADMSISMTAPVEPGLYHGTWQMVNATGDRFGQKLTAVVRVAGPDGEEQHQIKPLEPR